MVRIKLESRLSNSQFRLIQIDMENCFFLRKKKKKKFQLDLLVIYWDGLKQRVPFPFDNQRMELFVELKFYHL